VNEKAHYHGIMCHDLLIKVGESKKILNIVNKIWGNPIYNGLDLMRIHAYIIFKNNIFKEFHFDFMEFTFLQFSIKSNFFELVQNKSNM
jgi:hypothetical protein